MGPEAPTRAVNSDSARPSSVPWELLRCPRCGSTLKREPDALSCLDRECAQRYPIIDGVPLLIDEAKSLLSIAEILRERFATSVSRSFTQRLVDRLPAISRNYGSRENSRRFADLLRARPRRRILVVGGRVLGAGLPTLLSLAEFELVETDVRFGPRTALICDAHDLPFPDGCFDGVVITAVLEHVLDPQRCVAEIHRVLAMDGIVYAETPFMQQVHEGRYDFTRFTHLGHRLLFRWFVEIDSGLVGGPGMALAWAWQYFLWSWASSRWSRALGLLVGRLSSFWLPYLDRFVLGRSGAFDAASAVYFLGRRSERPLDARELVRTYRGAMSPVPRTPW